MKALVLVLGFVAGAAAIVALATIPTQAASSTVTPATQHVTLVVLDNHDRMTGANLVLHPGPVDLTIVNRATHSHLFNVPTLAVRHVVLPLSTTHVHFTVHDGVFGWFCVFPPCADEMSGDIYVSDRPASPHGTPWATAA